MSDEEPPADVGPPDEGKDIEKPASEVGKSAGRAKEDRDKPTGLVGRFALFLRQTVAELRKVIWPTRKELISYTWVVLVFVVVMGAIIGVLDFAFAKGVLRVFGT